MDLQSGDLVVLDRGPLLPAMMATAALPPSSRRSEQGRWLIDGGVLNIPLTSRVATTWTGSWRSRSRPSSGFALDPDPGTQRSRGLSIGGLSRFGGNGADWHTPFLVAETGINLTQQLINRTRMDLCPPDMLLEVALPGVGMLSTNGSQIAIEAGYRTAQERLDELKALAAPLLPAWRERWRRFRRRVQIAWRILRGPAYPLYPEPPRE